MRKLTNFSIACATFLLVTPIVSGAALAIDPDAKAYDQQQAEQNDSDKEAKGEEQAVESKAPPAKAEEKRICRRVKLDMSSRRATRVCKTKEEWRLFNQRR